MKYSTVLMRDLQTLQSSSTSASQNATARNGPKTGRQSHELQMGKEEIEHIK